MCDLVNCTMRQYDCRCHMLCSRIEPHEVVDHRLEEMSKSGNLRPGTLLRYLP